jgi:GAF domain-containing protein
MLDPKETVKITLPDRSTIRPDRPAEGRSKEETAGDSGSPRPGVRADIVPEDMTGKWQQVIDLLARIYEVPAGLILRLHEQKAEVLVGSRTGRNPFRPGEAEEPLERLCLRTVSNQDRPFTLDNALQLELWDKTPDLPPSLTSYVGVPLAWPTGEAFGSICLLDDKPVKFGPGYRELILAFKEVVEDQLRLLSEIEQRKGAESRLQEKAKDLQLFNDKLIDREMRIIEVKKEVNALCRELGREPRYPQWSDRESESQD